MSNQIDFFIVGLPRSRMAWIANYLTWDDQIAYFDAFAEGLNGTGPECIERLHGAAPSTGIADGAAAMFQDRLIAKYPKAKWVVVTRPHDQVIASLKRLGVSIDDRLNTIDCKIGELRLKVKPLVVPFPSLDFTIKDIAHFVNPSWECPKWRHDMLIGLNVQSRLTNADLLKIPAINPLSEKAEPMQVTQTQDDYFKLLQEICGDNKLAYGWLWQAIEVASIVDHVMDGEIIDLRHFDMVMKGVLLEWGLNEFFLKNSRYLLPTMSAALSAWQHATGEMKRVKHYDIYTELPCAVAFMRGGQPLVDQFSPRLRSLVEQLMIEDNIRDEHS